MNLHYGLDPGVKFYTHLSDQFGPFHTKVIAATANEAPYVLDGLLYHQSSLVINEHYTDTGCKVLTTLRTVLGIHSAKCRYAAETVSERRPRPDSRPQH